MKNMAVWTVVEHQSIRSGSAHIISSCFLAERSPMPRNTLVKAGLSLGSIEEEPSACRGTLWPTQLTHSLCA